MSGKQKRRIFRVLEVNKAYYPHVGGIETLVRQYTRELGAADGVEVTALVCRDGRGRTIYSHEDTPERERIIRAGSFGTYFSCPVSLSFIRLFRKLSKNADAVHINVPFPLADLALLLSGYKGRVVVSWHSDVVKQKRLLKLYRPLLLRLLHRADAIAAATQGHIDGSEWLSMPEFRKKCVIVPYGIDPEEYLSVERRPVLTQRLNNKNAAKLFFTGRLVYYKGVGTLLKAMCLTADESYPCELFIAGTGAMESELKAECSRLGLDKRVHFLGYLSDTELRQAYADCDIFILPSVERSEAFGIVQLEAMIYGKPVINTLLPTGVPHVSLNKVTGYTVPPGDFESLAGAIVRLLHNPELMREYGSAAAERVQKEFLEKDVIKRLYRVLRGDS
ncbi:MAG: glycosyltransferase [Ruminococcus sp.]|nr:glycosyltransferase [Ruminococcus sp.]